MRTGNFILLSGLFLYTSCFVGAHISICRPRIKVENPDIQEKSAETYWNYYGTKFTTTIYYFHLFY